jgi:hypothetical protein
VRFRARSSPLSIVFFFFNLWQKSLRLAVRANLLRKVPQAHVDLNVLGNMILAKQLEPVHCLELGKKKLVDGPHSCSQILNPILSSSKMRFRCRIHKLITIGQFGKVKLATHVLTGAKVGDLFYLAFSFSFRLYHICDH